MTTIRIFILLLLVFTTQIFAQIQSQILESYPIGQDFYQDGIAGFYEDFQKVMLDEKITSCENPEEKYTINFIIYPNKEIKYVKDFDTLAIKNNKCAFDNVRKVFPKLKNWKPATYENATVPALVNIGINPSDVLDYEFKIGNNGKKYFRNKTISEIEYPGGLSNFRKEVGNIFSQVLNSSSKLSKHNYINLKIGFDVDEEGKILNPKIIYSNIEFDKPDQDDFFRRLKNLKKFTPAKKNGKPLKSSFTFPISVTVS
ncbi:hypothetical protein [Soonwooa sp.]|uniref:hypothetical protein n=1 Tax=Soonwooa sp. TaxID=1938592 RepID=UPI002897D8B8|nr:hypothetical protein [Soonwooa sp.]